MPPAVERKEEMSNVEIRPQMPPTPNAPGGAGECRICGCRNHALVFSAGLLAEVTRHQFGQVGADAGECRAGLE